MPLQARDVILVLRAKDEASRVIGQVGRSFGGLGDDASLAASRMIAAGSALISLSAGITGAGVGMLALVKNLASSAIDYQQQAALALTQVDGINVSLEDLKELGRTVAKEIPVPFEEIQGGLYDIFSSLDVTGREAETILKAFSKGAVAGQVDLQSAGRSTIAILNAFGLGADDVNRVMDVQFQLVRKGIGTYEEFASTIGLGLPGAVRAGQDVETLSAMLAFLTRNGLSASRAATSAGRALETLSNSKVVERLEDMGVQVKDSDGGFRRLEDIVVDLGKKMEGLTDPERAAALNELFQGAGNTIQARRFWDTAVKNYDEFNQRAAEMQDAAGAMDAAYDIMFDQPLTQIELLRNKFKVFGETIGEALIPRLQIVGHYLGRLADWLNNLSPETKQLIADVLLIGGALTTAIGALSGFAGIALLVGGTIKMFGGLGAVIGVALKFWGIIGLIATAAYLVYQNWDKIWPFIQEYWPKVKEKAEAFLNWMKATWEKYWPKIREVLVNTLNWMEEKWKQYWPTIKEALRDTLTWIRATWEKYWPQIKDFLVAVLEGLKAAWEWLWPRLRSAVERFIGWFRENWPAIKEGFQTAYEWAKRAIEGIVEAAQWLWGKLQEFAAWFWDNFGPGIKDVWTGISEHVIPIVQGLWDIISTIFRYIWEVVKKYVKPIVDFVSSHWEEIWLITKDVFRIIGRIVEGFAKHMLEVVKFLWNTLGSFFENGLQVIRGVIDLIAGILTGDWQRAWEGIKNIFSGIWDFITDLLYYAWEAIKGIITNGLETVWNVLEAGLQLIVDLFLMFKDAALAALWTVLNWLAELPVKILEAVGDLGTTLWEAGEDLLRGFWNGIKLFWTNPKVWLVDLPLKVLKAVGDLTATLWDKGWDLLKGLFDGIKSLWSYSVPWLLNLGLHAIRAIGDLTLTLWSKGWDLIRGFFKGLKDTWNTLVRWLEDLWRMARSAVGDLGNTLWNAGWNIIKGLFRGMRSAWDDSKGWLTDVGGFIGRLKGPPAYDAKILVGNGELIMRGLQRGMEAEWGKIEAWLRNLAPTMQLTLPEGVLVPSPSTLTSGTQTATTTIHVAEGAVQLAVGSVRSDADLTAMQEMIDQAFIDLRQELSQNTYRNG